jgi:hypothetical protein
MARVSNYNVKVTRAAKEAAAAAASTRSTSALAATFAAAVVVDTAKESWPTRGALPSPVEELEEEEEEDNDDCAPAARSQTVDCSPRTAAASAATSAV